ncbi:MAG: radical SAM protein [Candidatus Thermoplasmatota archaeon]
MVKISEIKCKTALSESKLPGLKYSLNPYTGCEHSCIYCYVPNVTHVYRNRWGNFVKIKKNIPVVLSKELRKKTRGRVGVSTVTDPYQPIEKKQRITRYCLEQLLMHDFPVCIQTKSKLVNRDKDLIAKFNDAELMISIGTLYDDERQILEPFSSTIQERIQILKHFSDTTITTSIFFGPIYPTIKPSEISKIVNRFKKYDVSKIMIDKFNLKPGIWENIKDKVKEEELLNKFKKNINDNDFYRRIREEFIIETKKKDIEFTDAF